MKQRIETHEHEGKKYDTIVLYHRFNPLPLVSREDVILDDLGFTLESFSNNPPTRNSKDQHKVSAEWVKTQTLNMLHFRGHE